MAESDSENIREDSNKILISIRDCLRGTAFGIGWIATTISSRTAIALLGMMAITLWYSSTKFHPAKASILDQVGEFDGNWISIGGRFFGRPFEISI
ncbi:hypothetical protein [Halorubrum sp. Ea1]|uniref:hypothetical protein n=1 Tax=Halorubrum sp. Ea1 TaxID=1480718 RepID=UPI0011405668|nr:hypothetical protein [Halorubrum sp. Ea1]